MSTAVHLLQSSSILNLYIVLGVTQTTFILFEISLNLTLCILQLKITDKIIQFCVFL
jgi:hypothetical protein